MCSPTGTRQPFPFYTQFGKKSYLLLLFFFAWSGVLASGTNDNSNATCVMVFTNSTSPSEFTKLSINYPTSLPVHVEFYQSLSGDIEVDVAWCSDDATLVSTLQRLFANLTLQVDGVMVSLGLNGRVLVEGTTAHATSDGARLTGSLTLVGALFVSLFLLPKSRLTGVLAIAIVCVALCAPSTHADSSTNIVTVRIGLPSQITQVCENNVCSAWPSASTPSPTDPSSSPSASSSSASSSSSEPSTSTAASSTSSASSTSASSASSTSTTGSSTTAAPTNATSSSSTSSTSSSTPTPAPTPAPTTLPGGPASLFFNLKVLIVSKDAKKPVLGADFATLAFASVGMPYDYVYMNASVDLSTYLSTSGTGQYSGIVSVYTNGKDPLSDAQNALVKAYQLKYSVKWVIVGCTSIAGLTGVTAGASVSSEYFQVTFAPEFVKYGQFLNQSISVNTKTTINWSDYQNTPSVLLPLTITDPSTVTPVLMAEPSSGNAVAAAVFKMADGTEQMRYFLTQGSDYIHSMAFASVMVNWISPGGLFIGARRLTFSVQPDDLFLGSYIWNLTSHTNPVGANDTWYRISADDLQLLADNLDAINAALPEGSYITVEWPVNFGGINNSYYTRNQHDFLYDKSQELIEKFYYLSHTWDHPCTFDTLSPAEGLTTMNTEVAQNKAYAPKFFGDKMHLWSNFSMITPCVTGLYNGGALQAMSNNGISACVSDESVDAGTVDYEPITPYHGVYSTSAKNGFDGMYFVPREALDIDYCAMTPEDVIDEYATLKSKNDPSFDFDGLMNVQRMYAIEDKIAFRHDLFMMHQTNAATFFYQDPTPDPRFNFGSAYKTSLVALYMQRVAGDIMLYYNLPIVTIQMDNLVNMFQQRQTMDACGITATLGVDANNQIVGLSVTSQQTCQMSLSGGAVLTGDNVRMEKYSVETTAWIDLTAQSFTLSTPAPM